MAKAAPVFRFGKPKAALTDLAKRERHGRIEGRRGVELRKRRLAAEPLCRICKSLGRIAAATVPDHIKPLALGGTDTDDNIRCLCKACHDEVTAVQFGRQPQGGGGLKSRT